jgi:hypothetical protein
MSLAAGARVTSASPPRSAAPAGLRALRLATLLFAAGFLLHNGDHLRRGLDALTPEVFWAGTAGAVVSLVAIGLVLGRHRLAPAVAVVAGFALAAGVAAVHLLPPWGALSDSLPGAGVDALSWVAVLLEIGGALALGAAGVYAVRHRGARPWT